MKYKELEAYLSKLEKSLGTIAVSEKAEIITEIKSHALDAVDNDPNATIASILASLGEPEQVASKYLLERGLSPQKPPKHPIIKWLVIGFLGTATLVVLSISIIIWKFTPFISVDEEKGRVQIMGGLIDVNEKSGNVKIGGISEDSSYSNEFEGTYDLSKLKTNVLSFDFLNTKSEFSINDKNQIEYDCKLDGQANIESTSEITFDFKETADSKCYFKVPAKYNLKIKSQNGKFNFEKLQNHLNLDVMNGKVNFIPNDSIEYTYDLSVMNGKIDEFNNSKKDNAYKIKISIMNGTISN